MKSLKSAEQTHWTIFNFLVKLFAFGLTLISLLCIGLSLLELGGKIAWLSGYFGDSPIVPLLFFSVLFVMGVLLIKAKPYNPTIRKKDRFI